MELKRKEGESVSSFLYRFNKKIQQSGVLREAKKRRFHGRPINRLKRKLSALHRETKNQEREVAKKLGLL
ncbi:MAG: 30S ribosomal protein S21 [Patescibacteria group bacterium]